MRYIKRFFSELTNIKYDLIGIHWPKSTEVFNNLIIVLSVSALFGLYIFGLDSASVIFYKYLL